MEKGKKHSWLYERNFPLSFFVFLAAVDLIKNLLQVKLRKRYTADKSLAHPWLQVSYIGSVRLASLGQPRCVAFFFSRTSMGNYLHTFVLEKENATHRGQPGEANRTHP